MRHHSWYGLCHFPDPSLGTPLFQKNSVFNFVKKKEFKVGDFLIVFKSESIAQREKKKSTPYSGSQSTAY